MGSKGASFEEGGGGGSGGGRGFLPGNSFRKLGLLCTVTRAFLW